MPAANEATDRRVERRAMTDDELTQLLAVTQRGPKRFGMAGSDRAMAYRLAVGTGLRVSELRSLTPESFDLKSKTVTVAAAYSKRRRSTSSGCWPSLYWTL